MPSNALRLFRRNPVRRAALDELALHAEERRLLLVPARQRAELVFDPEERAMKRSRCGASVEDQRRLVLRGQRVRPGAPRDEPIAQRRIRGAEMLEEGVVQRDEAVAPVQIGEVEPEAQRERRFVRNPRPCGVGIHVGF